MYVLCTHYSAVGESMIVAKWLVILYDGGATIFTRFGAMWRYKLHKRAGTYHTIVLSV